MKLEAVQTINSRIYMYPILMKLTGDGSPGYDTYGVRASLPGEEKSVIVKRKSKMIQNVLFGSAPALLL